jgi:hypothetical protein
MITFRTCLISELSLLSGVKRRLDLETPKGGFWRKAVVCRMGGYGKSVPERLRLTIDLCDDPKFLQPRCARGVRASVDLTSFSFTQKSGSRKATVLRQR